MVVYPTISLITADCNNSSVFYYIDIEKIINKSCLKEEVTCHQQFSKEKTT